MTAQKKKNQEDQHQSQHDTVGADIDAHHHQLSVFPNLDSILPGGLTDEQAIAFQQLQAMHGVLPGLAATFPRPTVKRRKPIKWELWEEKNLIEGVRRYGRGNWAQIRAAFEFNQCRTNVDLHDKWRVLTGERKRNRQRVGGSSSEHSPAESPVVSDESKLQMVPLSGSNNLYAFTPGWHMDPRQMQFTPDILQHFHQNELMSNAAAAHEHQVQLLQAMDASGAMPTPSQTPITITTSNGNTVTTTPVTTPPATATKRSRKRKMEGDEDEIAQELIKLAAEVSSASDLTNLLGEDQNVDVTNMGSHGDDLSAVLNGSAHSDIGLIKIDEVNVDDELTAPEPKRKSAQTSRRGGTKKTKKTPA